MARRNATADAPSDEGNYHHHVKPAKWRDLRWPTCIKEINVRFLNGSYQQKLLVAELVREHYNTIPMSVQFRFFLDPDGDSDIRVLFVKMGDSHSYVGVSNLIVPEQKPTMMLNLEHKNPDNNKNTILHEFGHALCLEHEHQHPGSGIRLNRRALLKGKNTNAECIDDNYEIQPSLFCPWRTEPYDRHSVMHYGFSKGQLRDPEAYILVNPAVSQGDRNQLLQMYPLKESHKPKLLYTTADSKKLTRGIFEATKKESRWAKFFLRVKGR